MAAGRKASARLHYYTKRDHVATLKQSYIYPFLHAIPFLAILGASRS